MSMKEAIRLTQYSHGAGCGCKISPKVLETILHSNQAKFIDPQLLVGNETRDDAAVYDLGNGTCVISTTDFFMPIVDDPFDFGRIAATNAISDIFAMGGKPIMAIAICISNHRLMPRRYNRSSRCISNRSKPNRRVTVCFIRC